MTVSPLIRQTVIDTVSSLCRAFDERDWGLMRECLADVIATDYSRFRGTPPARLDAEEFVRLRQSGLAGLTTQHLCGNHLVTLESETSAVCRCDFVIHRWPEDAGDRRYFHTYGFYLYGFALANGGKWRIDRITQHAVRSEGTPELHGAHRSPPPTPDVSDVFTTASPQETAALGRRLAADARPGDVWALVGDLGAGKTHFVQGIAAGLGAAGTATSPTFTLVHEYGGGRLPVFHFDFYRLESASEVLALGWEEYIDEGGGLTLVEWADKFPAILPPGTRWWRFEIGVGDARRIEME